MVVIDICTSFLDYNFLREDLEFMSELKTCSFSSGKFVYRTRLNTPIKSYLSNEADSGSCLF